jgi:hypothetical protein
MEAKPGLHKYDGEIVEHVLPAGTYVLATKYSDGDPGDAWGVGYYLESFKFAADGELRHRVIDNDGRYLYGPKGFKLIRSGLQDDVGAWLVEHADVLQASPPGSVNLWGMLTDLAFGKRDDYVTGGNVDGENETTPTPDGEG